MLQAWDCSVYLHVPYHKLHIFTHLLWLREQNIYHFESKLKVMSQSCIKKDFNFYWWSPPQQKLFLYNTSINNTAHTKGSEGSGWTCKYYRAGYTQEMVRCSRSQEVHYKLYQMYYWSARGGEVWAVLLKNKQCVNERKCTSCILHYKLQQTW